MARYLFASQNKITENRNRKELGKNLPVARAKPAHPAQQAQRGTGVFFPVPRPEAARWNACSTPPTPPTSPGHAAASPRHLFTPGDSQKATASIPSPLDLLPLSSSRVRRRPKAHRSAPP